MTWTGSGEANLLRFENQARATSNEVGRPNGAGALRNESDLDERVRSFGATYGLSEREQQIIRLLAAGTHPKVIGVQMGCAYSSVRTYLKRAGKKLSCSGTREIVIRFFSDGSSG
jgi:DNA-binding CsgD family transcriptional regulator